MGRFLLRRLLFMLVTMVAVSAIVFVISEIVPIDVARNILGPYASADSLEHLRKQMGLDLPVMARYWRWLSHTVQGDLGLSTHYQAPVASLLWRRLANSAIFGGHHQVRSLVLQCQPNQHMPRRRVLHHVVQRLLRNTVQVRTHIGFDVVKVALHLKHTTPGHLVIEVAAQPL